MKFSKLSLLKAMLTLLNKPGFWLSNSNSKCLGQDTKYEFKHTFDYCIYKHTVSTITEYTLLENIFYAKTVTLKR